MKKLPFIMPLLALLFLMGGCTNKDNFTGNNWFDHQFGEVKDSLAVVGGYHYRISDEELSPLDTQRKNILCGNWQGAKAKAIFQFSNLPKRKLADISEPKLSFEVMRSSRADEQPFNLRLYKVKEGYTTEPDTLTAEMLQVINIEIEWNKHTTIKDTLEITLPYSVFEEWLNPMADEEGEEIVPPADIAFVLEVDSEEEGFVELNPIIGNQGNKLSFKYKEVSINRDEEYKNFSSFNTRNSYSHFRGEGEESGAGFKVSNIQSQRMVLELNPNFSLFKGANGEALSENLLKRVHINHAQLVLYTKDNQNFKNATVYSFKPFLIKGDYEEGKVIEKDNIVQTDFNFTSVLSSSADSLALNITPIIQAYISGKTFEDGELIQSSSGILIQSMNERKDFGEVEFYDLDAVDEKKPYILIKYTPPFL